MIKNVLWTVAAVVLAAIIFAGCKSSAFAGNTKVIELEGNPATGYTWQYTIGDSSVVKLEEDVKYLGKKNMVGAPSLFKYSVTGLKPGKTTLTFEYKRSWEKQPAESVRVYEVLVTEKGKVQLNEKPAQTEMVTVEKAAEQKNTFKSVSMDEGTALMAKDSNFVLLDVRTPEEYDAGHIPGAVQLTNETFTKAEAEKLIADKNQKIYVYCRSGRRSKQSAQKLVDFGYKNVIEIGGIMYYSGALEKGQK